MATLAYPLYLLADVVVQLYIMLMLCMMHYTYIALHACMHITMIPNWPIKGVNAFGEVHGTQSRCFNFEIRTEWMWQGNTVTPQVGGACYEVLPTTCNSNEQLRT